MWDMRVKDLLLRVLVAALAAVVLLMVYMVYIAITSPAGDLGW